MQVKDASHHIYINLFQNISEQDSHKSVNYLMKLCL